MTARMDSLIENGYTIEKFSDLPKPYQMAIVWRTVMECDGWDEVPIPDWKSEDEAKAELSLLIPNYVELYGEELFGMVTLSAEALKSSVMKDEDIASSYASWRTTTQHTLVEAPRRIQKLTAGLFCCPTTTMKL